MGEGGRWHDILHVRQRGGNWCQCKQRRGENVFVHCPVQPAKLTREEVTLRMVVRLHSPILLTK